MKQVKLRVNGMLRAQRPYLQRLTLFEQLPDAEIERLGRRIALRSYPAKSYIYFSFPDVPQVYVIKEGYVEIGCLESGGRELILDLLGPNHFFGVLSVGAEHQSFARSATETDVWVIQEKDFLNVLKRYPDLALQVIHHQGSRIQFLEGRLRDLVFRNVQHRVCQLLFTCYTKFGNTHTGRLEVPLTHQEIANLVGCSRETATATLSALKKQGIIDYGKKYIKVILPQVLYTRLAESPEG